jgi:hypothetical protein
MTRPPSRMPASFLPPEVRKDIATGPACACEQDELEIDDMPTAVVAPCDFHAGMAAGIGICRG